MWMFPKEFPLFLSRGTFELLSRAQGSTVASSENEERRNILLHILFPCFIERCSSHSGIALSNMEVTPLVPDTNLA